MSASPMAESSPVLLEPNVAPKLSSEVASVTTGPKSSAKASVGLEGEAWWQQGGVEPTFHLVNLGDLSSLGDLMASESKPLYGAGLHSLPLLLNHSRQRSLSSQDDREMASTCDQAPWSTQTAMRGAPACLSEACGRP